MVNYSKYANKLISKDLAPISSKKSILSYFFSKKYEPSVTVIRLITHDPNISIYMYVYIHHGLICLKRSVLFFPDFISFKGRGYSLSSIKYNDYLFEIYLKKLRIRVDNSNIYNYIKNKYQTNNIGY